ncbi:hypothetical protein SLEP1_g38488 [Rubroshorea leprosula]|nr:hypothetical protein SLEP1_g38488 [Rubroshorea leprosula]
MAYLSAMLVSEKAGEAKRFFVSVSTGEVGDGNSIYITVSPKFCCYPVLNMLGSNCGRHRYFSTTVEWAVSELLKQPKLIKKATDELDRVIGRERWVQEKDIPQLPYLEAIMKETMRKHPVAVLLAPHLALEDSGATTIIYIFV